MPNVQDFLLEQGLQCDGKIKLSHNGANQNVMVLSSLHYAVYKNDMTSVQKMLSTGSNINGKSILLDVSVDYASYRNLQSAGPFKEETLVSVLEIACKNGSLEMVKFLVENGAKIGDTQYHVPNGPEGDLVAGYLQTHGSKPVIRF